LPKTPLLHEFASSVSGLPEGLANVFRNVTRTFIEGSPNQEQEQEQDQEQERAARAATPATDAVKNRRGHETHAESGGRICLTEFQADQFARASGGPYEPALAAVKAWARAMIARFDEGGDWARMVLNETHLKTWDTLWERQGAEWVYGAL